MIRVNLSGKNFNNIEDLKQYPQTANIYFLSLQVRRLMAHSAQNKKDIRCFRVLIQKNHRLKKYIEYAEKRYSVKFDIDFRNKYGV